MKSTLSYFKSSASAAPSGSPQVLSLECLEERRMLSTVSIFAQGSTGQESFEATANGINIAVVTNVPTELTEYQFDVADGIDADDIRIEFLNDVFDPANGIDRNLTVDRIQINNRIFETDDPSVFSTGTYTAADGIQDGFGRGDTLNSNGFFQFSEDAFSGTADVTEVTIDARGQGDIVDFELQVDGERVEFFSLSARAGVPAGVFDVTLDGDISADRIRVAFLNDAMFDNPFGGGGTIDRNLVINSVTIDGEVYQGTDSDVFSTGTFLNADGVQDGFGRGNTLHANGFFQFADRDSGSTQGTVVVIDAAGFGDSIDFELQVDGQSVRSFALSPRAGTSARVFTVTLDETVSADRIRVAFTNDLIFTDPISGGLIDRNLLINSVTIDGEVFRGTDSDVFSTGTYLAVDGVQPGFGRGNFLHANGFFQFA